MPEPMPGQGEQKQRPNYNRPVSQGQVIWTDAGVCVCVKLCTEEFLTFLRLISTN